MLALAAVAAVLVAPAATPLYPLPAPAVAQCERIQAGVRFAVLCPKRLPRATRGWRSGETPPRLHSDFFGSPGRPGLRTPNGLEFGYSAPVEPQSAGIGGGCSGTTGRAASCTSRSSVLPGPRPREGCVPRGSVGRRGCSGPPAATVSRGRSATGGRITRGSSGTSEAASTPRACTTSAPGRLASSAG